jgi:hypothetical protein
MKARLARWLVRWSARWWDASYAAWVRKDKGEVGARYDAYWAWGARNVQRLALPLASRLDSDATGAEMVEHGWWG